MGLGGSLVVAAAVVEASVLRANQRVASNLSLLVLRALDVGEECPNMFWCISSSHRHLRTQCLMGLLGNHVLVVPGYFAKRTICHASLLSMVGEGDVQEVVYSSSFCFGLGVCTLVSWDRFVVWCPPECCWTMYGHLGPSLDTEC